MIYYELLYRKDAKSEWELYLAYDTLEGIKSAHRLHSKRKQGQWKYNEVVLNVVPELHNSASTITPLEIIQRNINRIDLLLLSLWVIALFGITYLLTQFL